MQWTPEKVEKLRRLADTGYQVRYLAGEFGCGFKAVQSALARFGFKAGNANPGKLLRRGLDSGPLPKRSAAPISPDDFDELAR